MLEIGDRLFAKACIGAGCARLRTVVANIDTVQEIVAAMIDFRAAIAKGESVEALHGYAARLGALWLKWAKAFRRSAGRP